MTKILIAERAKELAGAWYENGVNEWGEYLSQRFYSIWPNVDVFVKHNWTRYLEAARKVQVSLLTAPGLSQEEKDRIKDDLQAYNERRMKQRPAKVGYGPLMLRPDRPGTLEQRVFGKG